MNGAFNSEIYDPITGLWSNVQGGTSRWYHTATLLPNGKVLVAGGYELVFPNARLASAEIYDPATGLMSGTSQMINARAGHRATLLQNGKVLATGDGAR